MQLHELEPPFKIFYWFACEKFLGKIADKYNIFPYNMENL